MNVADSRHLASELESLGYHPSERAEDANVIVINTCVVRQQPEDRAINRLLNLQPVKRKRPDTIIGLMGCLVGVKKPQDTLSKRFPFVDVFMAPSETGALINLLLEKEASRWDSTDRIERDAIQDGDQILPIEKRGKLVSAHVPVVLGCSHACSYCVIPFRRGPEQSRQPTDIVAETRALISQGVREITLLGQIVDRYGLDLEKGITLPELLARLNDLDGLERLRFLTSHPNWMTDQLLDSVRELPKVCEHIEVPVQSGDDDILRAMKRGYTSNQYRELVTKIREKIPDVAIHCDIIVGFPGETEKRFQNTYDLLAELKLDKVHIARYSPRPDTLSSRKMIDDVPEEEKERRRKVLDNLQATIAGEINQKFMGRDVQVLVEDKQKGRWRGRTRQNKLVFFEDTRNLRGNLIDVRIQWTGPWSMVGTAFDRITPAANAKLLQVQNKPITN